MPTLLELLKPICLKVELVGSRITCNPPPTGTDQDYLILVKPRLLNPLMKFLQVTEWEGGGSNPGVMNHEEDDTFESYRKGDDNLIITTSETYFDKFMVATSVAKRFNLLKKEDRIILFDAVLYAHACKQSIETTQEIDYLA